MNSPIQSGLSASLRFLLKAALLTMFAGAAWAETSEVTPAGFLVSIQEDNNAPPSAVFGALITPSRWWNPEHSYSSDARNLNLEPVGGGCFCERWATGSVEHARVVLVKQDALLRMTGSLGPLQSMAVSGVLEFTTTLQEGRTLLKLRYRVNGTAGSKLDQWAGPVESMLTDQAVRLKRVVETGRPEPVTPVN